MGSMVSGLAEGVLGVVEGLGLSADTVVRYRKCCEAVVEFCGQRNFDALSGSVIEEFVACQQERKRRGEIGPNRRKALVKSARMMWEFQTTGAVTWRMMSPDPDLILSESARVVLKQFTAGASVELAPGSVRLLAGEIRQFLAYLDRAGQGTVGTVTVDDVRGFLVEVAPNRTAGTGNVVWSLKSLHDLSGHLRKMKCWRVAAGCGRRTFLAATSAPRVWCGTVGTSECRYEHEPEIPLYTVCFVGAGELGHAKAQAAYLGSPVDAGPYTYVWLDALFHKVREGGRVVHYLTDDQLERYTGWFANARRTRQLLTELETLSLRIAERAEGWEPQAPPTGHRPRTGTAASASSTERQQAQR